MSVRSMSFRLAGLCCLLSFCVDFQYAFSSTYTNSAVHSFENFINVSSTKHQKQMTDSSYSLLWNIIVNVWFIGFFVGIWLSRWLTDRYGRKPAILVGSGLNVVGAVLRCLSIVLYQPFILIIGRLLCSTATSLAYCALVLFLQEITPSSLRGAASCLNGNIYSFIAILGITLGNDELLGKHLAYYMGFAIVPCLFSFVALWFVPETPKYLVAKGKSEEAAKSIMFYQGVRSDVSTTLKTIQFDVDHLSGDEAKFIDLFRKKHLRNALLLALAAIQNTVALWTILLSSTYYLEKTGLEHSVAQWSSTVMAVAYFAGTTSSVFTVESFGRRPLLIWSNILNMGSLVFYTLFAQLEPMLPDSKYGCLFMLAVFGFSYGAGVGPVSRFVGAELVPLNYRSILTSVVFSENTIFNIITSFACRPLFDDIGPYAFIILYVIPSVLCTIYVYLYLPETKGREVREIVHILETQ